MPICMVDKNGISAPIVLCDVCGEVITKAIDGNYEWVPREEPSKRHIPVPVCFTHKRCSNEFERQHAPQGGVSCNHELLYFPLYLGNNLELDWEMAKRYAGDIAG